MRAVWEALLMLVVAIVGLVGGFALVYAIAPLLR